MSAPSQMNLVKINEPDGAVQSEEVPVLCYHQIRDWETSDSKSARVYITPPAPFKKQMQMLLDSGYHFILHDELLSRISGNNKLLANRLW